MNKIKKEIRLFKLLEKLKKRDLYNHFNNINLLNEELDKTDQRAKEVLNETFDLFVYLDANEEQLDFPVLYASG